jgi:hypothetical protein
LASSTVACEAGLGVPVGVAVLVPPAVGDAVLVVAVEPHAATMSPAAARWSSDRRSIASDDTG